MERALWAAVRALEESAALSRRLSYKEKGALSRRFADKADTQMEQANLIKDILLRGGMLSNPDASKV
jgi:hypothetical protein